MKRTLTVRHNEMTATLNGVDMGGEGQLIARNQGSVVVKWPATRVTYNGYTDYEPPFTVVYAIDEIVSSIEKPLVSVYEVRELVNWSNGRNR